MVNELFQNCAFILCLWTRANTPSARSLILCSCNHLSFQKRVQAHPQLKYTQPWRRKSGHTYGLGQDRKTKAVHDQPSATKAISSLVALCLSHLLKIMPRPPNSGGRQALAHATGQWPPLACFLPLHKNFLQIFSIAFVAHGGRLTCMAK